MGIFDDPVLSAAAPASVAQEAVKGSSRILLFGETGKGKSTLAEALGRIIDTSGSPVFCLGTDPGSPAFGVPGAVNLARWQGCGWQPVSMFPLCSLNAGRFRLPLVSAARRLAALADNATLLVDTPGITRGVAGAELLTGLVTELSIEAILLLCGEKRKIPYSHELAATPARIFRVAPSPLARRPGNRRRRQLRTRLWDTSLHGARPLELKTESLSFTGTPPPVDAPWAWKGRQVALMNGKTFLAMGEVLGLDKGWLRLLAPPGLPPCDGLLIRDALRGKSGELETAVPLQAAAGPQGSPSRAKAKAPENDPSPGITIRMGGLSAHLMNGVFGDPLIHLRIMNLKQSMLFDLGGGERLPAKLAHQLTDVFITHAHMDHISGFFPLLRARIGNLPQLNIFGPPGMVSHIQGMVNGVLWDRAERINTRFRVYEIHGDEMHASDIHAGSSTPTPAGGQRLRNQIILQSAAFNVRAIQLDHGTPVMAYKIELQPVLNIKRQALTRKGLPPGPWLGQLKQAVAKGMPQTPVHLPLGSPVSAGSLARDLIRVSPARALVYATDFADTPGNRNRLVRFARKAHTLCCEASFTQSHRDKAGSSGHLTAAACGEIARAANVGRLLPFHFSKRYESAPGRIYQEIGSVFKGQII
ncbi:MAG: hypothetical protein HUN04_11870 [Desulfobacter sp.]|nr:MAG: hypothetical protein HUN04_11870 [Desulfobacter sp.]